MARFTIVMPKVYPVNTDTARTEIATMIAETINRGPAPGYPVALNGGTMSFQLDTENDWWIGFNEDGHSFQLTHRNFVDKALQGLSMWIAYRLRAELVTEL